MNNSRWIGSLALILLGAAGGFFGGLGWAGPGPTDEITPSTDPSSDGPLLKHIEILVERLAAERQPEIPAQDHTPEANRQEVQADVNALGLVGIRMALSRIEKDLTEIKVAMAPPDERLLPEDGKFFPKKTDLLHELADRLVKEPSPPKGIQWTPTSAVYFGWTVRKVYATFGIPDFSGLGELNYATGRNVRSDSRGPYVVFKYEQGLVYDVHIRG